MAQRQYVAPVSALYVTEWCLAQARAAPSPASSPLNLTLTALWYHSRLFCSRTSSTHAHRHTGAPLQRAITLTPASLPHTLPPLAEAGWCLHTCNSQPLLPTLSTRTGSQSCNHVWVAGSLPIPHLAGREPVFDLFRGKTEGLRKGGDPLATVPSTAVLCLWHGRRRLYAFNTFCACDMAGASAMPWKVWATALSVRRVRRLITSGTRVTASSSSSYRGSTPRCLPPSHASNAQKL